MNKLIMGTDFHIKKSNMEIVKKAAKELFDLAIKLDEDKVFLLGDIFDSRVSQSIEILNVFDDIIEDAFIKGITLHIIPGNHDKTDYNSDRSFLKFFRFHPSISLVENFDYLDFGKTRVHLLPFFDPKGELWAANLKSCVNNIKKGSDNVLLSHCSVVGSINNDGSKVTDSVKISALKGFKKVFLGHYHNMQKPASNVWHIPSLIQHNFGEDNKKGATILWEDGEVEFIKLSFPEYKKIKIDLGKVSRDEIIELGIEYANKNREDNVRFELIGTEQEVQSFDVGSLNEIGIDVKKKRVDLVPHEISLELPDELMVFKPEDVLSRFTGFCNDHAINHDEGLKLLRAILKPRFR